MRKENISSLGTIITSLLATSCCIGPAIFVVFGTSVGFLGKMTMFEPYRPYFLGAAAAMLGFSFWKLYFKKTDCDCIEDVRAKKIARVILWVGTGLFLLALLFQKIIKSVPAVAVDGKLAGCCLGRGVDETTLRAAGLGQPIA